MANTILGKDVILFLWDGENTAYKPIACLTSNGMNTSVESKESPITKCSPTKTITPGEFTYELSFEGQFIDTTSVGGDTAKASYDFIKDLQMKHSVDGELIYWKQNTGITGEFVYGKGILTSLELSNPADAESTFSGTIQGSGLLSDTTLVV